MSEVTDWAQAPPEAPTATNTFMREGGLVVRTRRGWREKIKRKIRVEIGSRVGCEDTERVKRKN